MSDAWSWLWLVPAYLIAGGATAFFCEYATYFLLGNRLSDTYADWVYVRKKVEERPTPSESFRAIWIAFVLAWPLLLVLIVVAVVASLLSDD